MTKLGKVGWYAAHVATGAVLFGVLVACAMVIKARYTLPPAKGTSLTLALPFQPLGWQCIGVDHRDAAGTLVTQVATTPSSVTLKWYDREGGEVLVTESTRLVMQCVPVPRLERARGAGEGP